MIQLLTTLAAASPTTAFCQLNGGGFLGFPHWYKYLKGVQVGSECVVHISHINDVWLIVAAVIELLLRIGAVVAIGMVIAGGVMYITSEGNPDKTKRALNTVIMAVIGLAITIASAAIVSFVAGRFS